MCFISSPFFLSFFLFPPLFFARAVQPTRYCLSDKPQLKDFDPAVTGLQEYPITEYQPVYFVADSFNSAKDKMRKFAASLSRPFQVRYNPYTESIDILETAQVRRKTK